MLVVHIPHSSALIPTDDRSALLLTDQALQQELLVMTDWFTDELFAVPPGVARTVAFPVSRLVLDPERFLDDAQEPMVKQGMGVIYERTSAQVQLRYGPSPTERAALVDGYYHPHHEALTSAVADSLADHERCLIVDGHSFSSVPLPHEFDQDPDRPDICIGADGFHTPADLIEQTAALFREVGWRVEVNRPFAGAIVPLAHYGQDRRVSSIMIEVNRRLYMDETTGDKRTDFERVQLELAAVLDRLAGGRHRPR